MSLHNPLEPSCGDFPASCPDGAVCEPKIGFTARAKWTARCPSGSYGLSATADGVGTSTISQADANAKALADAKLNAQHLLTCSAIPIGARRLRSLF